MNAPTSANTTMPIPAMSGRMRPFKWTVLAPNAAKNVIARAFRTDMSLLKSTAATMELVQMHHPPRSLFRTRTVEFDNLSDMP
jgi:hypothetical protein